MKNIFCLYLLMTLACNSNKTPQQEPSSCNTLATVVDLQNLDGCRFLLQVENGEKWLPLRMPTGFEFHKGQKVRFDYKEVEDYVSICMAENKGVHITCIEEVAAASPPLPECTENVQVQKVDWIMKTIRDVRPRQITRYNDNDGYSYYFESNTKGYLYSCKGVLLCDTELGNESECLKVVKKLSGAKIVWQRM